MVGFLAPQLGETAGSAGGTLVQADTSVGDALANVGSIFDGIGASMRKGATVATQKDRDNEALQPFVAEVARLQKIRGQIGESQFNSSLNVKFKEFVTSNPVLVADARASTLAITGLELGQEEFNLVNEQQEAITAFLDTPRGQLSMFEVVNQAKNPSTGELDPDMAFALLSKAAAEEAFEGAQLDALKRQSEIEATTTGINENRLKQVVDEQLFHFGELAQSTVDGFVNAAINSNVKLDDSAVVLAGLRQQRQQMKTEIDRAARRGGFANHPDFNADIALAPYDNVISTIQALGTDAVAAFEAMQAMDNITAAELINGVSGFGGTNRDIVNYVFQSVLAQDATDLEIAIQALDPTIIKEQQRGVSLFPNTAVTVTEAAPPLPETASTDEVTVAARELTDNERKHEVQVGLATFGQYVHEHDGNENFRATATEGFGAAAAAMNTSSQPVAEATFDKMYDAKFFNTYSSIVGHGDQTSANLQAAVVTNLSTVFEQRLGFTTTRIANDFSEALPSLTATFSNGKVVVSLPKATTRVERNLLKRLKEKGFKPTLEGIQQLINDDVHNFVKLGIGLSDVATLRRIGDIQGEVAYLNKIVGVVKRLPDLSPHVLPQIEERLNDSSAFVPLISSAEDYNNLEVGDAYSYVLDGVMFTDVVGQERQ